MPFGKYKDFEACIKDQMKGGKYTREQAGGICGMIEKKHKAKHEMSETINELTEELDKI